MELEFSEPLKFFYVLWTDSAHVHFGWSPLHAVQDSFPDIVQCVSVGIMLEDNKNYVVLTQSSDTECTAVSNTLKIPKNAILEMRELKTISKPKSTKK